MGANLADPVATWVWRTPGDVVGAVAFAVARRLREVYLAVGRDGVDSATRRLAEAMRANGIAVSCLGGDPHWTVDHGAALDWLERASADWPFDGAQLDVEPWALPEWPREADRLMDGYATLVERLAPRGPLTVDLVPWLADAHGDALDRVVGHCASIVVLAYRDRAQRILADVRGVQAICAVHGVRYRIGVETQPVGPTVPAGITFGDDGGAVMARELGAVAAGIGDDLFDGVAVHHLDSWRAMRR